MSNLSRRELLQYLAALSTATIACSDNPPNNTVPMDASMPGDADASMSGDASGKDAGDEGWMAIEPNNDPTPDPRFAHSVLSGDPLPDAIVLWTRVTPDEGRTEAVAVTWQIAEDPSFTRNMREGTASAEARRDFTVKVDVTMLNPATTYYYRFRALGAMSPIGRTRTAPRGAATQLRFAVVSCSSMAHGYFHAYRHIARQADLDAVIHLGDYIYEYANNAFGGVRMYDPPHECLTLSDYRRRYAHYRKDADVRALHRQHPLIAVWDDHEYANNAWVDGAGNHSSNEGNWADRKSAARQAWWEWMPVRETTDGHIFRKLSYGDLVDVVMLDTRAWGRAMQPGVNGTMIRDTTRQLLGAEQERWLFETVATSRARWKILGQQVMMAQLIQFLNDDQWDGYPEARSRFFRLLREMNLRDVVVLTGDIHTSWANELTEDPTNAAVYDPATGRGSLAVEFVTPAVSSPGFPSTLADYAQRITKESQHMKYVDLTQRGFVLLDVTAERLQGAFYHLDNVNTQTARIRFATAYSVATGTAALRREAMPAAPRTGGAALVA
jgi:alkaline phosphatase D